MAEPDQGDHGGRAREGERRAAVGECVAGAGVVGDQHAEQPGRRPRRDHGHRSRKQARVGGRDNGDSREHRGRPGPGEEAAQGAGAERTAPGTAAGTRAG
nr:hypothetical protein GCM10020092_083600 [Actinoplanes digitatis]